MTGPSCPSCKVRDQMKDAFLPPSIQLPGVQKDADEEGWRMQDPPDVEGIGRAGWTLLHSIAAYYPEKASSTVQQQASNLLHSLTTLYPCNFCAEDLKQIMEKSPPKLETRKEFGLWLCQAHNHVNEQLGKPQFDCNLIDERWRWTD